MNPAQQEFRKIASPPQGIAISGIIFAALYVISLVLIRLATPADPTEPGIWLADPFRRNCIRASLNLVPCAGIGFLWFMAALRSHIGLYEDQVFATVFFGSGLLFVGMLFAAAAASSGLMDTFGNGIGVPRQSEAYHVIRGQAYALMNTFGIRMAAVFMFVTSTIGLRTGVLGHNVTYSGFAGGMILLLTITNFAWIALIFPTWVLVVSLNILLTDLRPKDDYVEKDLFT